MRHLLIISLFILKIYAGCSSTLILNPDSNPNPSTFTYGPSRYQTAPFASDTWNCQSTYASRSILTYRPYIYLGKHDCNDAGCSYYKDQTAYSYRVVTTCPTGKIRGSDGVCVEPPPPTTCDWVSVPPWTETSLSQTYCVPHKGAIALSSIAYVDDHRFCEADTTCYALPYFCPVNTYYSNGQCISPNKAPTSGCPSGYYSYGYDIGGKCYTKLVCKDNESKTKIIEVSCKGGPVNPDTPDYPNAPDPDSAPSAQPYKDGVAACAAKQKLAKIMCESPNIFSFSCDPITGTVTKSDCKSPTVPTTNTPSEGDDTKGASTKDIKDLSNTLPTSIRDALKDFLSDGSMPHLEAIRGQFQSSLILDADRNDKLDSISASTDAGLVLQSDANEKLDGIKTSLDEGKTNESFSGFVDKNNFQDSNQTSRNSIMDQVSSFTGQIVSDATSITNQFDNAKTTISNGFQPVSLPSGGCTDISFNIPGSNVPNTIPLSRVPPVIAPYSPIFSILVYLAVMFYIFKFLFLFFISRSK
jgi:hypothetical protein